ncbi:MAG TPA: pseudouridine synthase [Magnetospirillaceae bacterium]|jgi:23S rRNA pseudouridine2605 synthase
MTDSEDDDAPVGEKGERIARRLARAGLCSRRDAERWIVEGRVRVDGNKLTTPAFLVTDKSRIVVDGKPLPAADRTRLWRYNKPLGLVTSHKDPQGRATVFERLPKELPRVVSVGRLDLNSEGLLLLTNDGALARKLELPSNGWLRRYRVRIHGRPEPEQLASLVRGVTIDGVRYGSIKAALDRQQGANAWLTVGLTEGRNREIRVVMQHLGFSVSRLIRVSYGPFQLGLLETGQVDEVPAHVIREQLGGEKPARNKKPRKDRKDAAKDEDGNEDGGA